MIPSTLKVSYDKGATWVASGGDISKYIVKDGPQSASFELKLNEFSKQTGGTLHKTGFSGGESI